MSVHRYFTLITGQILLCHSVTFSRRHTWKKKATHRRPMPHRHGALFRLLCEKALHERTGGFSGYPADRTYRTIYLTCGGCCGPRGPPQARPSRPPAQETREHRPFRGRSPLASCITKDNYHGPRGPHFDYLKDMIGRLGLDLREDTSISVKSEAKREAGIYKS